MFLEYLKNKNNSSINQVIGCSPIVNRWLNSKYNQLPLNVQKTIWKIISTAWQIKLHLKLNTLVSTRLAGLVLIQKIQRAAGAPAWGEFSKRNRKPRGNYLKGVKPFDHTHSEINIGIKAEILGCYEYAPFDVLIESCLNQLYYSDLHQARRPSNWWFRALHNGARTEVNAKLTPFTHMHVQHMEASSGVNTPTHALGPVSFESVFTNRAHPGALEHFFSISLTSLYRNAFQPWYRRAVCDRAAGINRLRLVRLNSSVAYSLLSNSMHVTHLDNSHGRAGEVTKKFGKHLWFQSKENLPMPRVVWGGSTNLTCKLVNMVNKSHLIYDTIPDHRVFNLNPPHRWKNLWLFNFEDEHVPTYSYVEVLPEIKQPLTKKYKISVPYNIDFFVVTCGNLDVRRELLSSVVLRVPKVRRKLPKVTLKLVGERWMAFRKPKVIEGIEKIAHKDNFSILRTTYSFSKSRFSRSRQYCRPIVIWSLYINIGLIYACHAAFYGISFNVGYVLQTAYLVMLPYFFYYLMSNWVLLCTNRPDKRARLMFKFLYKNVAELHRSLKKKWRNNKYVFFPTILVRGFEAKFTNSYIYNSYGIDRWCAPTYRKEISIFDTAAGRPFRSWVPGSSAVCSGRAKTFLKRGYYNKKSKCLKL